MSTKNSIFKAGDKVILNENFYLQPDGFSGVNLVCTEIREKKNKEGEMEQKEHTESYYYPKLDMALSKFVQITQNSSNTIEEILSINKQINETLNDFKTKHKNWL